MSCHRDQRFAIFVTLKERGFLLILATLVVHCRHMNIASVLQDVAVLFEILHTKCYVSVLEAGSAQSLMALASLMCHFHHTKEVG